MITLPHARAGDPVNSANPAYPPSEPPTYGSRLIRILCARTIEEVERLRPTWEALQRHPNTDIDFYLTILKSRPEVIRPHVILVEQDGVPHLLLVGRIEKRPLDLAIGYKTVQGPAARVLAILYRGILGDGTREELGMVLEHINTMLKDGEADLVNFNNLEVHSRLYTLALDWAPQIRRTHLLCASPHHRLAVGCSYEEYLRGLSRNTRKSLRRYGRRLMEDWGPSLAIRCYRSPQDAERIIQDAEAIARQTYQRGLGVGFEASDEMRRRIRLELERGWLRAWFLYRGTEPVAFSFMSCYHDVAYANETGYDPAYRDYRPGHFLNDRIIADLCANPAIKALDYGFGDAEYKRAICNEVWEEKQVQIFAPTWRGAALHLLQGTFGILNRIGRLFMEKTCLLQRIKRLWRHALIPCRPSLHCLLVFLGADGDITLIPESARVVLNALISS